MFQYWIQSFIWPTFLLSLQKHFKICGSITKCRFMINLFGKGSLDVRRRLRRTIETDLPYCKLRVISRSKWRLNTSFRFKDSLEKKICSGINHWYSCSNCKVTYYGKTLGSFQRSLTHGDPLSHLPYYHLLQCNCLINFDELNFLAAYSNKFKLL